MSDKDYKELLKTARKTDLKTLIANKENAKRASLDNPSNSNLQALDKATKMLDAFLENQRKQETSTRISWKQYRETDNRREVYRQLCALGYEVAERTFYRHCKKGKCCTNGEGLYTRRLAKQYATTTPGITRTGETIEDDEGQDVALSIRKQEKEIAKLDWHNKTAALNYKKEAGLLIEREGVYLEIAARLVALDSSYSIRVIEEELPRIIAACGGDMNKLPECQDLMKEAWDDLLNSFCTTDTFEVLFEDDEELDVDELLSDDDTSEEKSL